MTKRILLLCFFIVASTALIAQAPKEFSTNKSEFLKQADAFLNATKREDVKQTLGIFEDYLMSNQFSDAQFAKIREVGNEMLKKKMRAYPHFKHYFMSFNKMVEAKHVSGKFNSYITVTRQVLDNLKPGRYSPYLNFLKFASNLFESNALHSSSGGSRWVTTSDKYDFGFKDGIPFVRVPDLDLIGIRKNDSIIVRKTSGEYFPSEFLWKGSKGEVHWERKGVDQDAHVTF